jgi:hypothetical protein
VRLRGYAVALLLSFLSVPLLHLYLSVELSPAELLLHSLDIALGAALGLAALETIVAFWQRRVHWRLRSRRAAVGLAAFMACTVLLWVVAGMRGLLPESEVIRHKHVASGYSDMPLRILPIIAMILILSLQTVRHALLRNELEELRLVNRALAERDRTHPDEPVGAAREPAPVLELKHDRGELAVSPDRVVRVQAQENYCEFVLTAGSDEPTSSRPHPHPLVRMTLAQALERLPHDRFVQTHRSHVANLARVREVVREGRSWRLELADGESVPVSRGRIASVRERVQRHLGELG